MTTARTRIGRIRFPDGTELRALPGHDLRDTGLPFMLGPQPASPAWQADSTGAQLVRAALEASDDTPDPPDPREAFAPARPMPGVLPSNLPRAMAQDQIVDPGWAWPMLQGADWSGSSYLTEGIQWLGWPYLAELSQRAEYRLINETLAKEATRKWIKFTSGSRKDKQDRLDAIGGWFKRHKVREKFRRISELDGFFGRSNLFVSHGDRQDPELMKSRLLLTSKVITKGSIKGLKVVEPAWTYPGVYNSNDPLSDNFYQPKTWYVMGREVHVSRFRPFISREMPDILKPAYAFGGVSMSQLAKAYVDNWLRTRQAVSDSVAKYSTWVLKTAMGASLRPGVAVPQAPGLPVVASPLLSGAPNNLMANRGKLFVAQRSNHGVMMLDYGGGVVPAEELVNVAMPLTTLDLLQAQAQEQMASISHTPLVILLGITPSGLNASSEGEIQAWYAYVRSYQEHLFAPGLNELLQIAQLDMFGETDPEISYEFLPLFEESEAAKADRKKAQGDTYKGFVDGGAIAPSEWREQIADDEDLPFSHIEVDAPPDDLIDPNEQPDPNDGGMYGANENVPGGETFGEVKDQPSPEGGLAAGHAGRDVAPSGIQHRNPGGATTTMGAGSGLHLGSVPVAGGRGRLVADGSEGGLEEALAAAFREGVKFSAWFNQGRSGPAYAGDAEPAADEAPPELLAARLIASWGRDGLDVEGLRADDLLDLYDPEAMRVLLANDAEWREQDHPRGQPGNAGQFGPGGGGGNKAKSEAGPQGGGERASHTAAPRLLEEQGDPDITVESLLARHPPEVSAKIREIEQKLAKSVPTDAPVSKGGHKREDGEWTPERRRLHEEIVDSYFTPEKRAEALPEKGHKPTMIMLGGRGGSGKGYFLERNIDSSRFILLDNDGIKEKLPEYEGWNAALLHQEASEIYDRVDERARTLGLNIIHDATMKSYGSAEKRVKGYKDAGYDVAGYYVFAPPQLAADRAIKRFMGKSGRYVPVSYVLGSTSNESSFDKLSPEFSHWEVYRSSENGLEKVDARKST